MVVWASCPHAWDTPGTVDEYVAPVASCIGKASMSARSAIRGPSGPISHVRPVPPGRIFGDNPAAVRRVATNSEIGRAHELQSLMRISYDVFCLKTKKYCACERNTAGRR